MATEFIVKLKDRAGTLAPLVAALGDAGVNLRAIGGSRGIIGLVVADKDTAKTRRALKKAGYRASERSAMGTPRIIKPRRVAKAAQRSLKAVSDIRRATCSRDFPARHIASA